MAIILNSGRAVSNATGAFTTYSRNPEYLDLPSLSNGDEKVYILAKIYETANYFIIRAKSNYTVDWGDGTTTNYASNTVANHEIDWNNISASTVTSTGFRQVIITVTPQSGQTLNSFELRGDFYHPDDSNINYNLSIVDVKMASQSMTTMANAFKENRGIEQFEYVGTTPVLTTVSLCFSTSNNLRKIVQFNTSNVTSFNQFLMNCSKLIEAPKFDLSSATLVTNMYSYNSRMEYIQPYDLDNDAPNITSIASMFAFCGELTNVPITSATNITHFNSTFKQNKFTKFQVDCPSATTVTNMFEQCTQMVSCTATFPNTLTNTTQMFDACSLLVEIKPFNCINVTNSSTMFRSCGNLVDLSHPYWDFRNSLSMRYKFLSCGKLEKPPLHLGGGDLLYFSQSATNVKKWGQFHQAISSSSSSMTRAFLGNQSLEEIPDFTTPPTGTAMSNSFDGSYMLWKTPAWDLSGFTSLSNFMSNCWGLRQVNFTGAVVSHSYYRCQLSRAAIVNVFNNLGTASGTQTITVSQNPGSSELTASDLLIATNKGWTVSS